MKSEQIKQITNKATEQLIAALNEGRSETLTQYLAAIGRFHRYSLQQRHAHCIAEANGHARGGLSHLGQARAIREEGRPYHQLARAPVRRVHKRVEILLDETIWIAFEITPVVRIGETRRSNRGTSREGAKLPHLCLGQRAIHCAELVIFAHRRPVLQ